MTLVPMTPSTKFLLDVAAEDPENALALAEWVEREIISADISRFDYAEDVAKSLRSRNDLARTNLVATFVKRRAAGQPVDDVIRAAGYLAGLDYWVEHAFTEPIEKAEFKWDPKLHPRDQGGRFVRSVGQGVDNKAESKALDPSNPNYKEPPDFRAKMASEKSPMKRNRYVGQYNEVNDRVQQWASEGLLEDFDPYVSTGPAGARRAEQQLTVKNGEVQGLDMSHANDTTVHEVYLRPKADRTKEPGVRAGLAAVDLTGGGERTYQVGRAAGKAAESKDLPGLAQEWQSAGEKAVPRDVLYGRLVAGGKMAELAGGVSPTVGAVGTAARVAGGLGPHAEKIMGPTLQRAAYRYRGIETRPEDTTVKGVEQFGGDRMLALMTGQSVPSKQKRNPDGSPAEYTPQDFVSDIDANLFIPGKRGQPSVSAAASDVDRIAGYYNSISDVDGKPLRSMAKDRVRTIVQGDAATAAMLPHIPGNKESALAQQSGYPLPSHGVVIGSDGKVAYEATGYEHDHYLPFNLKHLKALSGGQYVRTRSTGGPTGEDIYAGLMSNARQFTVASRSGVFTVEFSPTFRGARRYNDKAVRMTRRYEKMLDTIGGGEVAERSLQQVDPEAYRGIVTRMADLHRNDPAAARTAITNEVRRVTAIRSLGDEDLQEQAYEAVTTEFQRAKRKPSGAAFEQAVRDKAVAFSEQFGGAAEPRPEMLKLDAVGYMRALKSLQASFPEYIRSVRVETLPDWMASRNMTPGTKLSQGTWATPGAKDTNAVAAGALHVGSVTGEGGRYNWKTGPRSAKESKGGTSTEQKASAGGGGGGGVKPTSTGASDTPPPAASLHKKVAQGASAAEVKADPLVAQLSGGIASWKQPAGPLNLVEYDTTPGPNTPERWDEQEAGPTNALTWLSTKPIRTMEEAKATNGEALRAFAVVVDAAEAERKTSGRVNTRLPDLTAALDAADRAHGLTPPKGAGERTPLVPSEWHSDAVNAAARGYLDGSSQEAAAELAGRHGTASPGVVQYAQKYSGASYDKRTEMVEHARKTTAESAERSAPAYEAVYKTALADGLIGADEQIDDATLAAAKSEDADFQALKKALPASKIVARYKDAVALGRQLFVAGGAGPKAPAQPGQIKASATRYRVLPDSHPVAVALNRNLVAVTSWSG